MKGIASILALASVATAHYVFPSLVVGGADTGAWKNVRLPILFSTLCFHFVLVKSLI